MTKLEEERAVKLARMFYRKISAKHRDILRGAWIRRLPALNKPNKSGEEE